MSKKNLYILVLISVISNAYGFLFGEEIFNTQNNILIIISPFVLLLGLIPIGWYLCRSGKIARWIAPILLPMLLFLSVRGGSKDYERAYQDCVQKGEQLRAVLATYQKSHGSYPDNLTQLQWPHLPGVRLIGGCILYYEGGKDWYRMSFENIMATESEPFKRISM